MLLVSLLLSTSMIMDTSSSLRFAKDRLRLDFRTNICSEESESGYLPFSYPVGVLILRVSPYLLLSSLSKFKISSSCDEECASFYGWALDIGMFSGAGGFLAI